MHVPTYRCIYTCKYMYVHAYTYPGFHLLEEEGILKLLPLINHLTSQIPPHSLLCPGQKHESEPPKFIFAFVYVTKKANLRLAKHLLRSAS